MAIPNFTYSFRRLAAVPLILSLILVVSTPSRAEERIEPYRLAIQVLKVAEKPPENIPPVFDILSKEYSDIRGADLVYLYMNALTTADIIATKRMEWFGKDSLPVQEISLAFGLVCLPFGKPHKITPDITAARLALFKNMFFSHQKRTMFQESLENIRKELTRENGRIPPLFPMLPSDLFR